MGPKPKRRKQREQFLAYGRKDLLQKIILAIDANLLFQLLYMDLDIPQQHYVFLKMEY